jgi:membrane protein implicated in regulation of membrane protease activity
MIAVVLIAVVVTLAGCAAPPAQTDTGTSDADGEFTGTVSEVREDEIEVEVDGDTLRFDTWDVCGDNTEEHISEGDEVTVVAERDDDDFDALRILDADGDELCE